MKGTRVRWTKIALVASDVLAELTHGLEERQALDVADRAADLDDHDVGAPCEIAASRHGLP